MCLLTWTASSTNYECSEEDSGSNKTEAKKLHIIAIFAILATGTFGCSVPTLGRWFPAISPDKDYFYLVKAFAAGVILATGFIHILPEATIEKLTPPAEYHLGLITGTRRSLVSTIRPLIAALSFHQLFEGLGLGSCIAQGKFSLKSVMIMSIFFSLTAPMGIVLGMGIASSYNENSHTALIYC
ncbi:zinc transporter 9-like [Carex rostrata]